NSKCSMGSKIAIFTMITKPWEIWEGLGGSNNEDLCIFNSTKVPRAIRNKA
ncbi:unnamed protein product, partial [Dovyalis caffra]